MANGVLGTADLAAATNTNVYQNTLSDMAMVTVNFCSRHNIPGLVRIAVSTAGAAGLVNSEYIEYDTEIPGHGVLERSGIAVSSSQYITVRSSISNMSVQVWGVETGS